MRPRSLCSRVGPEITCTCSSELGHLVEKRCSHFMALLEKGATVTILPSYKGKWPLSSTDRSWICSQWGMEAHGILCAVPLGPIQCRLLAASVLECTIGIKFTCTGEGNGTSLQYSCLENPRDGRASGLSSMGSHRVRHY